MTTLSYKGVAVTLPTGFEGRVFQRPTVVAGAEPEVVAQVATFAIPATTADFGGGATPLMGPDDIFTSLFEYGPASVGKALFSTEGFPRAIPARLYSPFTLRRGIAGQAGTQLFFTEAGRPFTIYVVLGSYVRRSLLVPRVDDLLGRFAISPRPDLSAPLVATPGPAGGGGL